MPAFGYQPVTRGCCSRLNKSGKKRINQKKDPGGKAISKEEDPQVPEAQESADQRGLGGIEAFGNNSKPLRVHG
jgi:hypothetical protein